MRIPDEFEPTRTPDGFVDDGEGQARFFFWLGDDGVEDDPNWDVDEGGAGEDDFEGTR